jgi:hypothetical protein
MLPSLFFEHVGLMGDCLFRGPIPSLALKPDTSRLPASCSSLPLHAEFGTGLVANHYPGRTSTG